MAAAADRLLRLAFSAWPALERTNNASRAPNATWARCVHGVHPPVYRRRARGSCDVNGSAAGRGEAHDVSLACTADVRAGQVALPLWDFQNMSP